MSDETTDFTFEIDGQLRTEADGWPGWEVERVRSFHDPKADWTNPDDHDVSAQYRNQRLVLTKTRTGTGTGTTFTAKFRYSLESKVNRYRIVPEDRLVLKLLGKKKVLAQLKLTGLMTHCHDWQEQSWEGQLDPEAFDLVDDLIIHAANVPIRKC